MNKNSILKIKNVNFSYGKTLALSNISFELESGDFLALIGPNGSGKTTLLKLILGLYSVDKGSIELLGEKVESFNNWSKIAYIPQKATHFDDTFPASVKEIVGMGLISKKRFPCFFCSFDWEKIHEVLKIVDMHKFANKRIGELSGGQQQRVLIARAIVSDPEILFLDEPTAGVDTKTQSKFYNLLRDLNKKGITIVLVSHDIGRVTKFVTKIASLNHTLEFYGSHKYFCAWDNEHNHHSKHEHKLCVNHN